MNLIINDSCNGNCKFCFAKGTKSYMGASDVKFLIENNYCAKVIKVMGGEPTLHPEIIDIIDVLAENNIVFNLDCCLYPCQIRGLEEHKEILSATTITHTLGCSRPPIIYKKYNEQFLATCCYKYRDENIIITDHKDYDEIEHKLSRIRSYDILSKKGLPGLCLDCADYLVYCKGLCKGHLEDVNDIST
jgi:hypothetical protein